MAKKAKKIKEIITVRETVVNNQGEVLVDQTKEYPQQQLIDDGYIKPKNIIYDIQIDTKPLRERFEQFKRVVEMIPQYIKVYKQINPDSGWIFKMSKEELHPLLDIIYKHI